MNSAARVLCLRCGKPAGPFGATFDEFCGCDQRDGSTFEELTPEQVAEVEAEDANEARWQAMEP